MTTILIVEDNEMNRDMLSRRLKRRGYEVLVAVDGEMGIELARTKAPDLILMDMSLPMIDGWEATRRLKADVYLTKPIDLTRLLAKMITLLLGDRPSLPHAASVPIGRMS